MRCWLSCKYINITGTSIAGKKKKTKKKKKKKKKKTIKKRLPKFISVTLPWISLILQEANGPRFAHLSKTLLFEGISVDAMQHCHSS